MPNFIIAFHKCIVAKSHNLQNEFPILLNFLALRLANAKFAPKSGWLGPWLGWVHGEMTQLGFPYLAGCSGSSNPVGNTAQPCSAAKLGALPKIVVVVYRCEHVQTCSPARPEMCSGLRLEYGACCIIGLSHFDTCSCAEDANCAGRQAAP